MATLFKMNPEGRDYLVSTGNGGRNNSGPSGRRQRGYYTIVRNLVDFAKRSTCVVWCSDSYKNRGSGFAPKR